MDNFTANIKGHFLYVNSIMDKDEKCVEICYLFDYIFYNIPDSLEIIDVFFVTLIFFWSDQNDVECARKP